MVINKFDGFIYRFNTLTIAYWSNYTNERRTYRVCLKNKKGLLSNLIYICKEKGNLKLIYSLLLYFKHHLTFHRIQNLHHMIFMSLIKVICFIMKLSQNNSLNFWFKCSLCTWCYKATSLIRLHLQHKKKINRNLINRFFSNKEIKNSPVRPHVQ